jgi:5'-nucleotidase
MRYRYVTLEWNGVKVGIMGLVEQEWLATLPLIEVEDVIYIDFVQEARRLCKVLREEEEVDLVVALTHMRVPNDMVLGAEVPEIDLILGGHDHHYEVTPAEPHGTLVVKSGTDFRELTLLQVTLGHSKPTVRSPVRTSRL